MEYREGYVYGLANCRDKALDTLLQEYPQIPGVFGRMTTYFTAFSRRMDSLEVNNELLQYKLLLAVSFMRTHICACEHIFHSENIEATTLLRKQLELIARMHEVEVKDLAKIYDKVPNISFARPLNVLYGQMSKVAHNADMGSLDMLGYLMDDEKHKRFCLYPIYNENTIYSFGVAIGQFLMFVVETILLQKAIFEEYNVQEDGDMVTEFLRYGLTTEIPFFKYLKTD